MKHSLLLTLTLLACSSPPPNPHTHPPSTIPDRTHTLRSGLHALVLTLQPRTPTPSPPEPALRNTPGIATVTRLPHPTHLQLRLTFDPTREPNLDQVLTLLGNLGHHPHTIELTAGGYLTRPLFDDAPHFRPSHWNHTFPLAPPVILDSGYLGIRAHVLLDAPQRWTLRILDWET